MVALWAKLESMAMSGNVGAYRLLTAYVVGKPVAVVNPDRVNHEEWEMRQEQPHAEEVAARMQSQLPHEPVLRTQRVMVQARAEAYLQQFRRAGEAVKARALKEKEREERRARRKEERRRRGAGG
jgi:hypothetical protein